MGIPAAPPRGWELSATCVAIERDGRADGAALARAVAGAETLARVLAHQARATFGTDSPPDRATLAALAEARAVGRLGRLGEALPAATDWAAWLGGLEPPFPPEVPWPAFDMSEEIDIELEKPCIEVTGKATQDGGEDIVFQIRLQKWYQPDLGRELYRVAGRLEERFGCRVLMCVILMWPAADGPGLTGTYRGTGPDGRPVEFAYQVRRAWEMDAAEVMHSPGTMMMVPLTKGAKGRMAELIAAVRARLAAAPPDAKTVELLWVMIYWAMGMVCPVAEAHALLGDLLPWLQGTAEYQKAYRAAFRTGYYQNLGPAAAEAVRDLIRGQGTRRFGGGPPAALGLDAEPSIDALEAIAHRVLTAARWDALVAGPV